MSIFNFLVVCSCVRFYLATLVRETSFTKVSTNGGELILEVHTNRSLLECSTICSGYHCPLCTGFVWDSLISRRCELLQSTITVTNNGGREIYKRDFVCSLNDGFQLVEQDRCMFCYLLVMNSARNYGDAKDHCYSMGAHLLHLDSTLEREAIKTLLPPGKEVWVGANDLQEQDVWVSEKYGTPLDPAIWRWASGEPNYAWERCGTILSDVYLFDEACSDLRTYVCERTLV